MATGGVLDPLKGEAVSFSSQKVNGDSESCLDSAKRGLEKGEHPSAGVPVGEPVASEEAGDLRCKDGLEEDALSTMRQGETVTKTQLSEKADEEGAIGRSR